MSDTPACGHSRLTILGSSGKDWACVDCQTVFALSATPPAPDFSAMTLGQLDALAARVGSAARTLQEARALLGGVERPASAPKPPPNIPADPEFLAQKQALLAANRQRNLDELPADLQQLERS